jgi:hypothetical protein
MKTRRLIGNCYVSTQHTRAIAKKPAHATVEKLLEGVFPSPSMHGLYNEDQLPLPVSQSVERESAGRQFRVVVVRSEKLVAEEGERPPLEAATKQPSEDRD